MPHILYYWCHEQSSQSVCCWTVTHNDMINIGLWLNWCGVTVWLFAEVWHLLCSTILSPVLLMWDCRQGCFILILGMIWPPYNLMRHDEGSLPCLHHFSRFFFRYKILFIFKGSCCWTLKGADLFSIVRQFLTRCLQLILLREQSVWVHLRNGRTIDQLNLIFHGTANVFHAIWMLMS